MEETFATLPDDYVVTSQAFTQVTHRDVYHSIDPSKPSLSQRGKVIIITGASRGIGRKVSQVKEDPAATNAPSIGIYYMFYHVGIRSQLCEGWCQSPCPRRTQQGSSR
jgi:hypothetical protein